MKTRAIQESTPNLSKGIDKRGLPYILTAFLVVQQVAPVTLLADSPTSTQPITTLTTTSTPTTTTSTYSIYSIFTPYKPYVPTSTSSATGTATIQPTSTVVSSPTAVTSPTIISTVSSIDEPVSTTNTDAFLMASPLSLPTTTQLIQPITTVEGGTGTFNSIQPASTVFQTLSTPATGDATATSTPVSQPTGTTPPPSGISDIDDSAASTNTSTAPTNTNTGSGTVTTIIPTNTNTGSGTVTTTPPLMDTTTGTGTIVNVSPPADTNTGINDTGVVIPPSDVVAGGGAGAVIAATATCQNSAGATVSCPELNPVSPSSLPPPPDTPPPPPTPPAPPIPPLPQSQTSPSTTSSGGGGGSSSSTSPFLDAGRPVSEASVFKSYDNRDNKDFGGAGGPVGFTGKVARELFEKLAQLRLREGKSNKTLPEDEANLEKQVSTDDENLEGDDNQYNETSNDKSKKKKIRKSKAASGENPQEAAEPAMNAAGNGVQKDKEIALEPTRDLGTVYSFMPNKPAEGINPSLPKIVNTISEPVPIPMKKATVGVANRPSERSVPRAFQIVKAKSLATNNNRVHQIVNPSTNGETINPNGFGANGGE